MFYQHVRKRWEKGLVSIGLPPKGIPGKASFEGRGMTSLAIKCLSVAERQKLVEIAKQDAIAKRDAGARPQVLRKDLVQRLTRYEYTEIHQALEILGEPSSTVLSLEDVRRVWDRVSVTLDHPGSNGGDLSDLQILEVELSEAGRFGDLKKSKND